MPVGDIDGMWASHWLMLVLAWFRCQTELDKSCGTLPL